MGKVQAIEHEANADVVDAMIDGAFNAVSCSPAHILHTTQQLHLINNMVHTANTTMLCCNVHIIGITLW